jgi:BolA-like protein 3
VVIVNDISGGCGAMYEILVESPDFKGITTIKQHRMITDTLKTEIKDMHGLRIYTSVPKEAQ